MTSAGRKGVLIATFGVVCVTPDAVLLRWAAATGAKLAAVVFWKCVFMAIVVYAYSTTEGGQSAALKHPGKVVAMGLTQAVSIICLSYAFELTYAANAVLCYSMHPLWSGVLGRVFLKDVLPTRTILALFGALGAMCVMFAPDLASGAAPQGKNGLGDALAIATSVTMAAFLTMARGSSRVAPDVSVSLASAIGLLLAALGVATVSFYNGTSILAGMTPAGFVACAVDGLAVGIVNVAFAVAPAYITAAQIGLISLIEAVFGPVWVFVIYHEVPPIFSIVGGVLIVAILAAHELFAKEEKQEPLDEPLLVDAPPVV